ncbi:FRG domain-containing protein [Arcobacter roscoffensis]|uniref:FRG domain-containing protein n=1 Tax=Arcobacter roscoffensis TaxID=2961520 RepID=A0ABY5E4C5_9BACT|nr:FRG domain-containing protein [Arcobacter roscoffensis]UTJ05588.1 FRG domain-containing protein [Arcobacter roscoffensis]
MTIMKIEESELTNIAQEDFELFINKIIKDKKYFYWTQEYFKRMEGVEFKYYEIFNELKDDINDRGKQIFLNDGSFSIKKSSLRNELDFTNISKYIIGFNKHSEYLKEYILFRILDEAYQSIDEEEQKENKEHYKKLLKNQKTNFIFSCLKYYIEEDKAFYFDGFNKFGSFSNHREFLNEFNNKINDKLKNRINNLWLNKNFEHNMDFVFHFSDNDDKEELRYALENLGKSNVEKNKLYFRGQAYSNWMLRPSIARTKNLLNNENDLFHKILALKPNDFKNDHTDYERLITMQHYGLPTRLLDVTRNPLIALYFACNNLARAEEDGLVYIFEENLQHIFLNPDDKRVKDLTDIVKQNISSIRTEGKEFLNKNHFIRGIAKNKRIDNQSGDFIFVGIDKVEGTEEIKHSKENKDVESFVSKYLVIDYDVKKSLLDDLEVMNIHGGSVYPELGGMSNYLVHKYED